MTDKIVTLFAKPAAPSGRKTPGPFDENAYQRGWQDAVEHLAAMAQAELAQRRSSDLRGCEDHASLDNLTLDELEQEREASYQRIGRIQAIIDSKSAQKPIAKGRRTFRPKRKPRLAIVKSNEPVPAA
jgi:hypothetical protein